MTCIRKVAEVDFQTCGVAGFGGFSEGRRIGFGDYTDDRRSGFGGFPEGRRMGFPEQRRFGVGFPDRRRFGFGDGVTSTFRLY